jgi:hypothetical protein
MTSPDLGRSQASLSDEDARRRIEPAAFATLAETVEALLALHGRRQLRESEGRRGLSRPIPLSPRAE